MPPTAQLRPHSMVPCLELLTDVLPSERLNRKGMPTGELRTEWRRVPNLRNALCVLGCWLQTAGVLVAIGAIADRVSWPAEIGLWACGFVALSRGMAMFNILGHEAAHRVLFSHKSLNDFVGQYLCSSPGFSSLAAYRRVHMAHHRDEFGPDEPDLALYAGYPITRASLVRKIKRDASGSSGVKILKGLLSGLKRPVSRPTTIGLLAFHAVLAVILGWVTRWWVWPVLWFGPFMTSWRVINRLRAIAEHAGMQQSSDTRETTHHVRQSRLAAFFMTPYNVGHHVAHHVDPGVSMWKLPLLTAELERVGYLTPTLIYPNYRALWRALGSRSSG